MDAKEYAKIVAKNLRRIAVENGKQQIDIAHDLGVNKATVSSWMNGTRTPKMSKIDMLCRYFNCSRADIMEEHPQGFVTSMTLTPDELAILNGYRSLNQVGQTTLQMQITMMLREDIYKK